MNRGHRRYAMTGLAGPRENQARDLVHGAVGRQPPCDAGDFQDEGEEQAQVKPTPVAELSEVLLQISPCFP